MPTYYKFNYALRNDTGEVVDSSEAAEALFFVEGDGSMIPGLEKAVMGKEVGDEFSVTIGPEDAYGWPQRQLVRTVSRDMMQKVRTFAIHNLRRRTVDENQSLLVCACCLALKADHQRQPQ